MLHFWLTVWQKAFLDSLNFIQQSWTSIAFSVLFVLITLVWLIYTHGWSGGVEKWLRTGAEAVVITIVAYLLVVVFHFAYEPMHLLKDEESRSLQARKSSYEVGEEKRACLADLQAETVKSGLLQSQVLSQQGIINQQQSTTNTQQSTFNLCVTTLAKTNAPIPQKTTMVATDYDPMDKPIAKHTKLIVFLTNKPITPVNLVVWCDGQVKQMEMEPLGSGPYSGELKQRSGIPNVWFMNLTLPTWTSETPILVKVYYDSDKKIESCFSRPL